MQKRRMIVRTSALLLATLATSLSSPAFATNGHQLSAIGAYAQGMGGAVTAAPYDASTAITNPAGMAMIGNRTDFSFQSFFPHRETEFAFGGGTTSGGSNFYLVPAVGWTAPMDDRNDWFFGGGMYGVSGMGVDYDTVSAPFLGGFGFVNPKAHIYSQYQFWKMAPTVAYKSSTFAIGVAINLDYQAFGFEQYYTDDTGQYLGFDMSEMQGTLGYGGSIGFIYQPVPEFSFGAAYISKQNFGNLKWRLSDNDVVALTNPAIFETYNSLDGIYTMDLDFPQQWAAGFAVRLGRPVLWTVDVKWINYSDTYDIAKLKGTFDVYAGGLPTGATASEVDLTFGWDDVWVYATGLQIDVTPNFAIRAGYNYSSSPIKTEDVDNNLAFPAIVKQRVAGGFTYRLGRHWELTMAYMKAFKEELTSPAPPAGSGTKISLEEQAADFEISYRF